MKKITILFIISLIVFEVNAQVKLGIMTGKSPSHISFGEITLDDTEDSLFIDVRTPNSPWLLGPYVRLCVGKIFVQTSLLVGVGTLDYEVKDLVTDEVTTYKDYEWHLDVPIEIGYLFFEDRVFVKAGILGANYFQHEQEDIFFDFDETFLDIFRNQNYGYRIGFGFDIENSTTVSLSYTNFQNVQNTIIVNNKVDYDFEFRQHQLMINFNWNLIKE